MDTIRQILQFRYDHQLPLTEVALASQISVGSVHNILSRAKTAGLDIWPLPDAMTDADLRTALYPPIPSVLTEDDRLEPDWLAIVYELNGGNTASRLPRAPKPTRRVLWEEYIAEAGRLGRPAYSYSRFCGLLACHLSGSVSGTASPGFTYSPGECLFTDYSGKTLRLTDGQTVEIFIGVLAWSGFIYAEATPSQKVEHWCMAHSRMFTAFGGVPTRTVCDNLKSGVTKNDSKGEVIIQKEFDELCRHYEVACLPARTYRPKDKALVENGVKCFGSRVLAPLRNDQFVTLAEMNRAIQEKLDRLNDTVMRRKEASRSELLVQERDWLRALPAKPWEWKTWETRKVASDCHIQFKCCYYSVPHAWCGQYVRVRVGAKLLEIFPRDGMTAIASHPRQPGKNRYSTIEKHLPPQHRAHQETLHPDYPARLEGQMRAIGPITSEWVDREINRRSHPYQAMRTFQGVRRLTEAYSVEAIEQACARAITLGRSGSGFLSDWLRSAFGAPKAPEEPIPPHKNIRGSAYWSSPSKDEEDPT